MLCDQEGKGWKEGSLYIFKHFLRSLAEYQSARLKDACGCHTVPQLPVRPSMVCGAQATANNGTTSAWVGLGQALGRVDRSGAVLRTAPHRRPPRPGTAGPARARPSRCGSWQPHGIRTDIR